MKIQYASMALLAGISVVCSSCVVPAAGYATYSAPGGVISTGVAWTNASYDADGFPIFGYSYGRPVYGYTSAGVAVFSIAALTALCFVPHWSPAWWYHGPHHYPHGIHRVSAPPRFPSGHRPGVRPPSGITPPPRPSGHVSRPAPHAPGHMPAAPNPPSHKGPAVLPAPAGRKIAPAPAVRPGNSHHVSTMPAPVGKKIAPAPAMRPGNSHPVSTMPAPVGKKIAPAPAVRPGNSHPVSTMPAPAGRKVASVPAVRPGNSHPVSTLPAPSGQRISATPRSSSSFGSSSSVSRPSAGMHHSGAASHSRGGHGRR